MGKEKDIHTTTHLRNTMARYIAALAFVGAVIADGGNHVDSGYAAPQSAYASPTNDYAAPAQTYEPSYNPPTYEEPQTYEYSAPGVSYEGGQLDTVDGFDLSKFTELIPLFIAVFAAIIIAQLVAPLFAVLFGAKVGLLGGIFAPLQGAKIALIQAILAPFNLVLGLNDGTCTPISRSFEARSMDFDVMTMIDVARNVYEALEQ